MTEETVTITDNSTGKQVTLPLLLSVMVTVSSVMISLPLSGQNGRGS